MNKGVTNNCYLIPVLKDINPVLEDIKDTKICQRLTSKGIRKFLEAQIKGNLQEGKKREPIQRSNKVHDNS